MCHQQKVPESDRDGQQGPGNQARAFCRVWLVAGLPSTENEGRRRDGKENEGEGKGHGGSGARVNPCSVLAQK